MKRRALVRHLRAHDHALLREGAKHSVFYNPANRRTTTVPRHTEIDDSLASKNCADLGITAA